MINRSSKQSLRINMETKLQFALTMNLNVVTSEIQTVRAWKRK
jgi:hypothetical protein